MTPAEAVEAVDVVIPVLDRRPTVGEAIASALAQTWPDVRVQVVDDGSTDGTADVLDALAADDERITVTHVPTGGVSAARNVGLANGNARLVTFLDSDDLMPPHRIERQVEHLRANPDLDGVVGTEAIVVADGITPPPSIRAQMERTGPRWYWQSLMITRDAIEAVGGYDEDVRHGEDLDLAARLRGAGATIGYLDEELVTRRILGDNMVMNEPGIGALLLDVIRRHQDRSGRR
ncbi:MAG: glycosyltransferase family A protein [Acidimicrobiales bacterium]